MAKYRFSTVIDKWHDSIISAEWGGDDEKLIKYYKMFLNYIDHEDFRGWEELVDWDEVIDSYPEDDPRRFDKEYVEESGWFQMVDFTEELSNRTERLLSDEVINEIQSNRY